jgi:hypothetical protein
MSFSGSQISIAGVVDARQMALTLMLYLPHSFATTRVMARIASLVAE